MPRSLLISTSDNILQFCRHDGKCFGNDIYHQWIIFDDLWAGRHPDLAKGILTYAKRWDVLS